MKRGTQAAIGCTILLLGAGVLALGFLDDEKRVRQVWDVVLDPAAHQRGDFILIGMPQPPLIAGIGEPRVNPDYQNHTTALAAWLDDDRLMHSVHTITVVVEGGVSHWTHTNRTQEAGRPGTATSTTTTWSIERPHTVFLIQGFPDNSGTTPYLWGVYEGVIRDEVQPKPSQFRGHLASSIGDQALPSGALVFHVNQYTAGCSSKFLPADHQ